MENFIFCAVINERIESISQIFCMEIFTTGRQQPRLLFLVAYGQVVQQVGLAGMVRQFIMKVKVISHKTKVLFPQFNAHNFKLKTKLCSHPIRLQNFFIVNISTTNHSMSWIFCMEIVTNEKKLVMVPFLVLCGQACPATSKLCETCQRCFPMI